MNSANNLSQPISTGWLPVSGKEMQQLGWRELDVILISGDAYVDHPAFGTAVIGRVIEKAGFRVGIIPQPNWRDDLRDFKKLGTPRLFFGVTAGNMDSMVNHYTAAKRIRSDDAYTPGGQAGFRPDYATTVYARILKKLFPDTPVVIGGIEASMRRTTHYDYWQDELKPAILVESGADLLIYGSGELPLLELLRLLRRGVPLNSLKTIRQTAFLQPVDEPIPSHKTWETSELVAHETCLADKTAFAANFKIIEQESNRKNAHRLVQKTGAQWLVINPPFPVMTEKEIDRSFDLPYTRLPHPKYRKRGPIPAYEMIRFSVTLHRGCFGGCSFCTISTHQGRFISSRSRKSILKEIRQIVAMEGFKGYISDLGGPSANMYRMSGLDDDQCDRCTRPSCIHPAICRNLSTHHQPLLDLYREVADMPEIKKVFIGSGVRYDLLMDDRPGESEGNRAYLEALITRHVSGRLKVAPEHTADHVLKLMRKPSFQRFLKFKAIFDEICRKNGLKQELVPYFISSHPGCRLADMAQLAVETGGLGYRLRQTQDFMPTPMTLSSVMYYSGLQPYTLKPVYTTCSAADRKAQQRFIYWYKKENSGWVKQQLKQMGLKTAIGKLFGGNNRF